MTIRLLLVGALAWTTGFNVGMGMRADPMDAVRACCPGGQASDAPCNQTRSCCLYAPSAASGSFSHSAPERSPVVLLSFTGTSFPETAYLAVASSRAPPGGSRHLRLASPRAPPRA